ncbi:hypothetical protein BJ875DRAFT_192451 [Amylocarpus encephaloides]|uniref:DUF7707 domain-containing protein n=1 Tax=Amylocarpus encephaloides TaxID=45428 RepID=A0A9P7Y9C1_9HELO|nr:hypothetical protein BJ875DRAFT_192451 [Amylocarpus encephaloides]
MPSIKTNVAVLATALFYMSANAQVQYQIDPDSVTLPIRNGWCDSQKATCPLLCKQLPGASSTTSSNTCDAATLTYSCVCGNGLSPNATEYSQTLPYFICTQYGQQCVAACGADNTCASHCRANNPCGAQNPERVNTSTITTMASTTTEGSGGAASTAAGGVVYNGLGGAATTSAAGGSVGGSSTGSSTGSGAQAALDMGRSYGLAVVFAGIFAGFALVM